MSKKDSPAGSTGGSVALPDLDLLPEKMRVHALAKLIGVTSREVLAALTGLGHEARSAQSSIERKVVEQIIGALVPDGAAADAGAAGAVGGAARGGADSAAGAAEGTATHDVGRGAATGRSAAGLATEGLATDGLATEGLATDGVATDGLATDGVAGGVADGATGATAVIEPGAAERPTSGRRS